MGAVVFSAWSLTSGEKKSAMHWVSTFCPLPISLSNIQQHNLDDWWEVKSNLLVLDGLHEVILWVRESKCAHLHVVCSWYVHCRTQVCETCWLMWNIQVSCSSLCLQSCQKGRNAVAKHLFSPSLRFKLDLHLWPNEHLFLLQEEMDKNLKLLKSLSCFWRNASRFYKPLQASAPLWQVIMIPSIVIGLMFHKGRGLVSDMLSELISVSLGLFDVVWQQQAKAPLKTSQNVFLGCFFYGS